MNGRFFGACFSIFGHKEGAIAPVDYSSTFATAPIKSSFLLMNSQGFYLLNNRSHTTRTNCSTTLTDFCAENRCIFM